MKDSVVGAFIAGGLLGAMGMWLVTHGDEPAAPAPPPTLESPVIQAPRARPIPDAPTPAATESVAAKPETRVAELEASLDAARKEAYAALLKGALVFEVDGRTPEQILEPLRDVEPTPGTKRFSSLPETALRSGPMGYLCTVIPEEFEEALGKYLDANKRWTDWLELDAEAVREIRAYTERGYRLAVALEQRQETYRKWIDEPGRLSAEERKALDEKFTGLSAVVTRVYHRSGDWVSRFRVLFPEKKK